MIQNVNGNPSGFPPATPEEVGIPSQAITDFLRSLKQNDYCLHAFMLMRNGKLCFSTAVAPYTLDTPHRVFSTGKSILALCVYFAIQEGFLHLEDRVAPFFRDVIGDNSAFDTMTVSDLLTMRSGQVDDAFPAILTDLDADLIQRFFQTPLVEDPGKTFRYNNTIPHIVYALVERATGIRFEDYQNTHLCQVLNAPIYAPTNPKVQYNPVVMAMSANSLMKVAQFYLQEGEWQGQRVLAAEYIREAVKLQTYTNQSGNSAEYGYQIWRNAFGGYRMDGGWGQYAILLPQENMAAIILSDMPNSVYALKAFEDELLKHLSPEALPANENAYQELCHIGDHLSIAPESGSVSSASEPTYFAQEYDFADPSMVIRFQKELNALKITVTKDEETTVFQCGLNRCWLPNPSHLLVKPERTIDNGVYCLNRDECLLSGTWSLDQVFDIVGKSLGALGQYQYRFTFSDHGLMLEYTPQVCRGCVGLHQPICIRAEGRKTADERSRT